MAGEKNNMQFLSSGSEDENLHPRLGSSGQPLYSDAVRPSSVLLNGSADDTGDTGRSFDLRRLLRKYWLLFAALLILGAVGGFVSVVLTSPKYRARLQLQVQNSSGSLPKSGVFEGGNSEVSKVDIQTQINILRSGNFLRRGAARMQSESVPLVPTGQDFFSRLRQRIHPATRDPLDAARSGLSVAVQSFVARPVIETTLIELTCESTSPDVAAEFLNAMAAEFVEH